MDSLVSTIRRAGDNGPLVVMTLEGNEDVLNKNVSHLDQFVNRCETTFRTCVQASVILAKLTACSTIDPLLATEVKTFFETADSDHLQLSKKTVRRIGNVLTNKLICHSSAIRGIPILRTAIAKMQNGSKYLTSLHVNICQLAISAKCFSPIISILNEDIMDIEPNDTLMYFYYGGMVYAALKMWERSYKFFNLACSLPNVSLSQVAIPAAQKLIIISLIYKGKPKQSDSKIFSRYKENLEPYTLLETAFTSEDVSALQTVIAENTPFFEQDKNMGLIKQLVDCHMKGRIRDLTELAGFESANNAEQKLLELAASKSIFVKIDHKSGYIRFLDDTTERYESPEVLSALIKKMNDTMVYDKILRQLQAEEYKNSNAEVPQSTVVPQSTTKRRSALN